MPAVGVLTAVVSTDTGTGRATFTNTSTTCSYPIGLAAYKKFDEVIDSQELYEYRVAVIPAGGSMTLTVPVPGCAYQIDAFRGALLSSFANGVRYSTENRLLDAEQFGGTAYCTLRCTTPVPTWTATPTRAATETRTATAVSTSTSTATRTLTPAATATMTKTATGTVTRTPTRTATATVTRTFTPTATPRSCPGVSSAVCTADGKRVVLVGGAGVYDGSVTRFTYQICGDPTSCPVSKYQDLSHFTIDLGGLCSSFTISTAQSSPGLDTNDPTCPLSGGPGAEVKWDLSIASGQCRTVTLALAGLVGTGPLSIGTKTATSCFITTALGPSCNDCGGTIMR